MPRLSIITVVLQNPQGLARTLESLDQLSAAMLSELELIVIDSSPEAHQSIRQKFKNFENLKWIDSHPHGIYAALNQGIQLSSGRILWHLHSGDWLSDFENLLLALRTLEESDRLLLISDVRLSRNEQDCFIFRHSPHLLKNLVGFSSVHHQGVLFKRELFQRLGVFSTEYSLAGDYEFFLRLAEAGIEPLFFNDAFATYDTGGRSLTGWRTIVREARAINREHPQTFTHLLKGELRLLLFKLRLGLITPLLERLGLYDLIRKSFYRWKS